MANPPPILFPLPIRFTHGGGVVGRRLATRPRGTAAGNALASPPADRAGFFSEPHRLSRRVVSAPARGCPLLHSSSAGGARTGSMRRPARASVQRSGRSGSSSKSATKFSPETCLYQDSAPNARRSPGRSTCCAPTSTPISARGPPTRALGLMSPPGREIDRSSIERSGTCSPVATPHQAEAKERRAE